MNSPKEIDQIILTKTQQELALLAELLDNEVRLLDGDKQSLYKPHPGQIRFHKSKAKIRLVITGNRWGKTTCSVNECIWLALGTHPYKTNKIPMRIKLYAECYNNIDQIFRLKFNEWLPRKYLALKKPYVYTQQGHLAGINFANGSIIRFATYEQQDMKAEGSNWDAVGFDEPPSRELFVANLRGLVDTNGSMWFSMTPLKEPWIFDDLWEPGINGRKKNIDCFGGTIHDNPYLDEEGKNAFVEEMTAQEREVRELGNFTTLQGMVIDTYQPEYSLIHPFELDHRHVIYEGIDPHSNKPHAALWKALDTYNRRYVVAELSCDQSMREFARQLVFKRRELTAGGARLIESIADTSLNQTDFAFRANQRDDFISVLRDMGERVFPQNAQKKDWLMPGITKLRDLYRLINHEENGNIYQAPTQFVFKSCVRYQFELKHYQWPKVSNLSDLKDTDKPIPKHNEYIDCDRYIESRAPEFTTPGQNALIKPGLHYQKIPDMQRRDHVEKIKKEFRSHHNQKNRIINYRFRGAKQYNLGRPQWKIW